MATRTEPLIHWEPMGVPPIDQRIAQAQERLKQARLSGKTAEPPTPAVDAAVHILHEAGLPNNAMSRAFVNRVLVLEETVQAQSELIVALNAEVQALKRKRFPNAETR